MKKDKTKDKETKKTQNRIRKFYSAVNLPESAFFDAPRMELNGNHKVSIDGCRMLLEYNENLVKLDVGKQEVSFLGKELDIKYLRPDALIISGEIVSIEFKDRIKKAKK
jgi:sporulation protein YqfC